MPTAIERRLDILVNEINEIKKEVILQKMQHLTKRAGKMSHWRSLGNRISEKWDHVSAVDEIRSQRGETLMKKMTVDSSVIIASLIEKEPRHQEAWELWDSILSGNNIAIMPYSVFVEVVAAIRRRTGSEELARDVKEALLNVESVSFVDLDRKTAEAAADLAIHSGLRGMDALVIQTAREFDGELITFDDEMAERAALVLKSHSI